MMTSIQNLVTQVIYEVYNEREQDLVSLKKFAISKIDELIRESEIAIKNTSEKAASMINDSDNIITCSYSSTILETFKMAKKQGKNFKVLVAESKCGKISYGRCLTEKLKSHKISTKVFPDKAIDFYALRSRIALVGADSILIDGSLINGKPTYNVAIATKKNNIPLYTVCETNKFNILTRKPELNKGFDLVPSNLITGIITEKGIIKPDIVVNYSKEKRKFFSLF
jgi:translation initiation factor eIF-2B subunit delta